MAKNKDVKQEVEAAPAPEKKERRDLEAEVLADVTAHEDRMDNTPTAVCERLKIGHSTGIRYLEILYRTGKLQRKKVANTAFYFVE